MVMQASSELLWTKKGVNQISKQEHCGHAGNDEIHGSASLETLTKACETPATDEKQHSNQDVRQVQHILHLDILSLCASRFAAWSDPSTVLRAGRTLG
jgi:hypothetical protein